MVEECIGVSGYATLFSSYYAIEVLNKCLAFYVCWLDERVKHAVGLVAVTDSASRLSHRVDGERGENLLCSFARRLVMEPLR